MSIDLMNRRLALGRGGCSLGATALGMLLARDGLASAAGVASNPFAPRPPHHSPKATAVIEIFCPGGMSHVDTFDYKPELERSNGKPFDAELGKQTFAGRGGAYAKSFWPFHRHGRCGKAISDLFPNLARRVDDIAFIHSMTADSPIHGSAMLMMNSGRILSGHPCLGSWVNYGLGSVNENLPGFVVMLDPRGGPISGAKNWSSGYMPATYQASVMRSSGSPILDLQPPQDFAGKPQRRMLDTLRQLNEQHLQTRADNSSLAARIANYELAWRMQSSAPEAVDLTQETQATQQLYGLDDPRSEKFGRQCLLARRLVERGVRFVQIYSGGAHNDDNWDAHFDMEANHNLHAGETDRPIAGLLQDLNERGLLKDTLIVWGGEFGRQPTAEYAKGSGRDHNSYGFTVWMAGGGIKGGVSYGGTDELGSRAVDHECHVKHMHATVLTLLGLSPEKLTYYFGGLENSLVGVEGAQPLWDIMA